MPTTFTPRFVDLVRCTCSTVGTGNLVLGAAVAGFASFAATLSVGDRFYYAVAGIDKPVEAEVGRGTFLADGSILREAMSGALTNFSLGQKTVSLVAGAEWFRKASAGAIDTATLATRDKSDLGAAVNELAKLSPLFSEIGTTRVPVSVRRIFTAGRSAVGQAPGAYIRDPDQSALTTIGQSWVDALPVAEQAAAVVAVKAILDRVRTKDADGLFWVIDDDGCQVHAGHFGAVADGWFAYNGSIAGTDNAAAIQALIDWRQYLRQFTPSQNRECLLPAGAFRINNGLQLGYGDAFRQVVLRGAGPTFGGGGNGGGTTLICDFDDRPGISIEGGRVSFAADLAIVCPRGLSYIYAKGLGDYANDAMSNFGIDDTQLTSWFDPARPTLSPYLRFNPHAGVAIDPYRGVQPGAAIAWVAGTPIAAGEYRTANAKLFIAKLAGTSAASGTGPSAAGDNLSDGTVTWAWVGPATLPVAYPAATPPAFIPAAYRTTYHAGKALSSNIPLTNVRIYGFTVGVALQPCNDDSNGDFLSLADCEINFAAIQISVGNTQARNIDVARLTGANFHTAVATNKHGRQNGKLGGIFHNCSWAACYQLIDLGGAAIVGPHSFKQCYVEDVQRIGDVYQGGTLWGTAIVFEACQFAFHHDDSNGGRGVPLTLLGNRLSPSGAGSPSSSLVFRDCVLGGFKGVAPLMTAGVRLDNSILQEADQFNIPGQWRARAYNTLAGGLVLPRFASCHAQLINYLAVNETSLAADGQMVTGRGNKSSSRDYPAAQYTPSLSPADGASSEEFSNPQVVVQLDKASSFTAMTLAGRVLRFTAPSWFDNGGADAFGFVAGGVLLDLPTGMVFFITTRTGPSTAYLFTAELQNGYSVSANGTLSLAMPFAAGEGNFCSAGGGVFMCREPLFATLTAGNPTLSACGRADGYGGFINNSAASQVQAGDRPFVDQRNDPSFYDGTRVTVVGAGSLTLNSAPAISATQKRLPLWVRGS